MSKDYYKILEVEKTASESEIKKAFHKMAHKYHPDKEGGDEAKFKEANEAYQVLSNKQKRAQYDQFGSAGPGAGAGFGGGQGFGGFDFSGFQQANGAQFDFGDLGDIFETFMGGGFQRQRKGRDIQLSVQLTFKESLFGVRKKISIPDLRDGKDSGKNKDFEVDIPAGIEHGQTLRLAGYGEEITDGRPGMLYLNILVEKHPLFHREGKHVVMDLDIKLTDAILGAKYEVESPVDGTMKVKIPEGIKSGEVLRVKGKGVQGGTFQRGDLFIRTKILIPKKLSREAKKAIETLRTEGL